MMELCDESILICQKTDINAETKPEVTHQPRRLVVEHPEKQDLGSTLKNENPSKFDKLKLIATHLNDVQDYKFPQRSVLSSLNLPATGLDDTKRLSRGDKIEVASKSTRRSRASNRKRNSKKRFPAKKMNLTKINCDHNSDDNSSERAQTNKNIPKSPASVLCDNINTLSLRKRKSRKRLPNDPNHSPKSPRKGFKQRPGELSLTTKSGLQVNLLDGFNEHDDKKNGKGRAKGKKGAWRKEEDELLRKLVEKHGPKKWKEIAEEFGGGRRAKQCRERWCHHLCPGIKKEPWTIEEYLYVAFYF